MADLSNYKAIAIYLNEHKHITGSIPAFEKTAGTYRLLIAEAEAITYLSQVINVGRNVNNSNIKNSLCFLAACVAYIAKEYALKARNNHLLQLIDLNVSGLLQAKDKTLVTFCNSLCNEAKKHFVMLQEYGLNERTLSILQTLTDLYDMVVLPPKVLGSLTDSYENRISQLINEARVVITSVLDTHIVLMKKTHKEFAAGYYALRRKIKGLKKVSQG